MNRQGMSWKAKLKYAIDQVIKESTDFEVFLLKCKAHGILVEYNPDHKIALKFMLREQKERNMKQGRSKNASHSTMYSMIYTPRTKIKVIKEKPENKFVQDAIDRGNMKVASITKNIIAEYDIEPEQIRPAAISAYTRSRHLLSELNTLQTLIADRSQKRSGVSCDG